MSLYKWKNPIIAFVCIFLFYHGLKYSKDIFRKKIGPKETLIKLIDETSKDIYFQKLWIIQEKLDIKKTIITKNIDRNNYLYDQITYDEWSIIFRTYDEWSIIFRDDSNYNFLPPVSVIINWKKSRKDSLLFLQEMIDWKKDWQDDLLFLRDMLEWDIKDLVVLERRLDSLKNELMKEKE